MLGRFILLCTVTAVIAGVVGGSVGAAPTATTADKNCSDFANQRDAQQYFDSHGGSPSNNVDDLDRDHDGTACDSNPCPCSKPGEGKPTEPGRV